MNDFKKEAPQKKDWWIDVALGIACVVVLVLIVQRLQVRNQPASDARASERAVEMGGVERGGDVNDGIPRLDFRVIERVTPDENHEPVFPSGIAELDGKTVRMQGFMSPYESLQDMSEFMLLNFPTGCNFCAPPAVNQVVLVRQKEGKRRYPFIDDMIQITGTLRLWSKDSEDPAHEDVMFIYIMEDTEVVALDMDPIQRERLHRDHSAQGRLPGL
ncbi:MAG: DUF3299 domain-containing protein [Verrucomicrobia bacterium]|nr:DUF3299 domain-containing protein [Verrucomicrobiota bacterium]MCH8514260.1 DUF3299 domain-containing protein [Kiritimatiellia bacterium]